MNRCSRSLTAIAFAALGLTACGAQQDSNYQGEPLVTVSGEVQAGPDSSPDAVDVILAYSPFVPNEPCLSSVGEAFATGQQPDLDCPLPFVAERAKVTGTFPASFRMDVLHPPPDAAFITGDNGLKIAFAYIYAAAAGSADDEVVKIQDLRGYTTYQLLYLSGSTPVTGRVCRLGTDNQVTCQTESVDPGFVLVRNLCLKGGITVASADDCFVVANPGESIGIELTDPLSAFIYSTTEHMN